MHDFTGQVVGAIGISGPIWRLSIPVLQKQTELVKAAARRLSTALGQPPEREPGDARTLVASGLNRGCGMAPTRLTV